MSGHLTSVEQSCMGGTATCMVNQTSRGWALPVLKAQVPCSCSCPRHKNSSGGHDGEFGLRGPAAILFISRDTCSDSIAKLFRACFHGVSHNYRAICCKMGYRTDVPV